MIAQQEFPTFFCEVFYRVIFSKSHLEKLQLIPVTIKQMHQSKQFPLSIINQIRKKHFFLNFFQLFSFRFCDAIEFSIIRPFSLAGEEEKDEILTQIRQYSHKSHPLNIIMTFKPYLQLDQDINLFSSSQEQYLQMKRLLANASNRYYQSYLLKNGRVVNSDFTFQGDVLLQNGKVTALSENLTHKEAKVIDCTNKLIIPGGIDTHTHMQLPFMGTYAADDFDQGTKAAIAGGTTSFLDFAIPSKGETLSQAFNTWRGWADPKVNCDYGLHSAIVEWNGQTPGEMKRMVQNGVTSFKFFMAYNNVLRIDDAAMYRAFECARDLGAICIVHAENGDIIEVNQKKLLDKGITGPEGHYFSRPESVEAEAVHRVITIAEHANCPVYIVHLMSREASEEVLRAKNRGLLVYGQTLAASLGTDGSKLFDKDWDVASRYVMSPSLNPDPKVKTQLMKYINSGVIDVVGTDNCTFCTDQKRLGRQAFNKIPNGVNGLQDRLSIVWTKGVKEGLISQNQFVEATSSRAAQIFNMYPRKGVIRVGSDADVVIWDPNYSRIISAATHHHKADFNIFEGMQVFGRAEHTFSNGNLVWDGKEFHNQQKGKYIKRGTFGYTFRRHQAWTTTNDPLNFKVDRDLKQSEPTKSAPASNDQIEKLAAEIKKLKSQNIELKNALQKNDTQTEKFYDKTGQLVDTYLALKQYLPKKVFDNIRQILYGTQTPEVPLRQETIQRASQIDVEVKQFRVNSEAEQIRSKRLVKVAAIQNKIVLETTKPIQEQKRAIMDRIKEIIEVAALQNVNVIGLQQIWNAPFFMCTRQRYPWVEFSEPIDGESTQMLQQLAKKHNMVIVTSILEREKVKETLHNTAVVIDNHGNILGKQEKGHIPRVGDFNESSYYMEGETGHPVFETEFGRIGINICYGRHHPLHWLGFGLNGAEIVFNPSATVNGLSEPLWGIEARNAAIANHYFSVGINRVGTEVYPSEFTSGDCKKAHHQFGHFYGSSYVAAPDGSRTPSLSRTRDGLLITELDLNLCRQVKDKWGFTMTGRHGLYAQLLTRFAKLDFEPQTVSLKKPQK